MNDLIVVVALVIALEGALYALFPEPMKRMAARVIDTPSDTLRIVGLVSAVIGVGTVWLVRG